MATAVVVAMIIAIVAVIMDMTIVLAVAKNEDILVVA